MAAIPLGQMTTGPSLPERDPQDPFVRGLRDGHRQRARGVDPVPELLNGNSDYALGFQAGFYGSPAEAAVR